MSDYKPGDPALLRVEIHRPPDDNDKGWIALRMHQPGGLGPMIIHAAAADILPAPAAGEFPIESYVKVMKTVEERDQARADLAAAEARIAAALEQHQEFHQCGAIWYAGKDSDYRGTIAVREDCPTVRALTAADSGEADSRGD